jgi:hypothetical protein
LDIIVCPLLIFLTNEENQTRTSSRNEKAKQMNILLCLIGIIAVQHLPMAIAAAGRSRRIVKGARGGLGNGTPRSFSVRKLDELPFEEDPEDSGPRRKKKGPTKRDYKSRRRNKYRKTCPHPRRSSGRGSLVPSRSVRKLASDKPEDSGPGSKNSSVKGGPSKRAYKSRRKRNGVDDYFERYLLGQVRDDFFSSPAGCNLLS